MSLFGLFERRASLENPAVPLTSSNLVSLLGGTAGESGVQVTETSGMRMPAVWRAVAVIANVAAALPLHTYAAGTRDRATVALLEDPHPELTRFELWRLVYVHRLLWGNAYLQKVRNGGGQIMQLWPIRPDRVKVDREAPTEGNPGGKVFWIQDDHGVRQRRTSREILHLPALGYDGVTGCSPVRAAAEGIGLGLAAEKAAAKLYGSGNMISGVLQTEQRLNAEQAAQLKANWKAKLGGAQAAHDIAVLDSGASFQPVTMPYKDSQFLESRQFQVTEVSRMFGVPPFLLMSTEKSTSWGTGLEQQAQGFVTWDLAPTWLTPTEQRVTKELLGSGQYAKYQVNGLLRGDSSARATFYRALRDTGAFSADDIRELEDLKPIGGPEGDMRLQPTYMAPLGSDPLAGQSAPAETEPDDRAARAARHLAAAHRLLTPEPVREEGPEDDQQE
ncbi:phage portal protein [Streptomyces sp. AVP053U2]|uniref:phage portal protein n=1 Tax=Streptomyces sp. AVP053U2 TaxID=1737066 RepID=UPI00073B1ECC|nr:phage portal protein [Streptomyces sp. AVP053U2]ODA69521.1 Phage portal protein [Streptomyces sp. AVP053U2]